MDNAPIELDFKSVQSGQAVSLRTFTSYSFDRNIMTPASAFRFTAPGVDKASRNAIRSGDLVNLWAISPDGSKNPIATGIIDETDTHGSAKSIEYVLTGRDVLGQLVDNSAVDAQNKIVNTSNFTLDAILRLLIKNTRIPSGFKSQQIPNGQLLFQTNPGETKINALQRYLEITNCLVWSQPNGQLILGKPNFTQKPSGKLFSSSQFANGNNMIDWRVRRNLNQAIRTIVSQLQTLGQVDAGSYTKNNNDPDMLKVVGAGVGRSVYSRFSYGGGNESVNTVTQVGNQSGNPRKIGDEYALRELARDNMKVLDVEAVVVGHVNADGLPYNIDQIYSVFIEDEDVKEDMFVYGVSYELTESLGTMTRLRLCRLGSIVAYTDAIGRTVAG
jgi:prophage tail gpP-like protein